MVKKKIRRGWHFLNLKGNTGHGHLTPKPKGTEVFKGYPIMCDQGLHASPMILDALDYAPGLLLRRVTLSGEFDNGSIPYMDDKFCATVRKEHWRVKFGPVLVRVAKRLLPRLDKEIFPLDYEDCNRSLQYLERASCGPKNKRSKTSNINQLRFAKEIVYCLVDSDTVSRDVFEKLLQKELVKQRRKGIDA